MDLWALVPRLQGSLAGNPDTSLGAVRAKDPVVTDAVGDGCECGEAALESLELWWVQMERRMCL